MLKFQHNLNKRLFAQGIGVPEAGIQTAEAIEQCLSKPRFTAIDRKKSKGEELAFVNEDSDEEENSENMTEGEDGDAEYEDFISDQSDHESNADSPEDAFSSFSDEESTPPPSLATLISSQGGPFAPMPRDDKEVPQRVENSVYAGNLCTLLRLAHLRL